MRPGYPDMAAEPIGSKWYVRSGLVQFVCMTDGGPVGACLKCFEWLLPMQLHYLLGPVLLCSQRGFEAESVAWAANTLQLLAENGAPTEILDEMEP